MGKSLTIQDVLRFSNHDLLNHLHLIQMNLDLNRVDEAKEVIQSIVKSCHSFSSINKYGLTKTAIWIQTFKWRYPALELTYHCNVTTPICMEWDELIEQYLEKTIIHIYESLNPFVEQSVTIHIETKEDGLMLLFDCKGQWDVEEMEELPTGFKVKLLEWTNQSWRFEISLKE